MICEELKSIKREYLLKGFALAKDNARAYNYDEPSWWDDQSTSTADIDWSSAEIELASALDKLKETE